MTGRITCHELPVILDWENDLHDVLEHAWPEMHWPFRGGDPDFLSHSFEWFGSRDSLMRSPYPKCPDPKVNEMIIPTGASRYGKALFLMDEESLCEIMNEAWGRCDLSSSSSSQTSSDESGRNTPVEIEYNDGANSFTWKMFLLQPQPIAGNDSLWLVPFADARLFWMKARRQPAPKAVGNDMEWNDVWIWLQEHLPYVEVANRSDIDSRFLACDREMFNQTMGINHAAVADAVALSIGMRAIHEITGSGEIALRFQDPDAADAERTDAVEANESSLLFGGYSPRPPLPDLLKVLYRRSVNNFRNCGVDLSDPVEFDEFVSSEEEYVLHSAMWTFWTFDGTVTERDSGSNADASSLESAIVDYMGDWGRIESFNASYAGVADWKVNGLDNYVSFSCGRDGGMRTMVRGLPSDFRPLVNFSQTRAYFLHAEDTAIWKITSDIPAGGAGLEMGFGTGTPMSITSSGGDLAATEAKRSDGSSFTQTIYNLAPGVVEAVDGESYVQTKRFSGLYERWWSVPLIDTEYCPAGEV